MPYVSVPKDLSKIKKKTVFNKFTARQAICIIGAGSVGIPVYLATKNFIGTDVAGIIMVLVMFPFLMFIGEIDGQPLEKVLKNYIETHFTRATDRPYETENIYDTMQKQIELEEEVEKILEREEAGKKKKGKIAVSPNMVLSKRTKKQIENAVNKAKREGNIPKSAQQTIPYRKPYKDGIFQVTDTFFTKSIQFFDINYQLASDDDKNNIFENYCDFLNYFDNTIHFQFSFINLEADKAELEAAIDIKMQDDEFNDIRKEYSDMLKAQLEKGNNGLVKTKYIIYGIHADNYKAAKTRLEKITIDILNNFKKIHTDVIAKPVSGYDRLKLLWEIFHPGTSEKFLFNWDALVKTGLSSKDFISPENFDFKDGARLDATHYFRFAERIGAVNHISIMAPELTDRMLADLLDIDSNILVTLHIDALDQEKAIKSVKNHLSEIQKTKADEQKKANQSGYDMDILPPELLDNEEEAQGWLKDLRKRNERMFLMTLTTMQTAKTKKALDDNIFQVNGICKQYNCNLKRLNNRQEQGFMSALPIGLNQIEIKRSLTTTSTAIFVPFTTQELFQSGKNCEPLYYGMNVLSNNMIMADRKKLKNPNGLIFGTPGCLTGSTRIQLADGTSKSFDELMVLKKEIKVRCYNEKTKTFTTAVGKELRVTKEVDTLIEIILSDKSIIQCTESHLIMNEKDEYIHAEDLVQGTILKGNLTILNISKKELVEKVKVYDLTVPIYFNFILENGVVVHNSGKSFSAKREMTNAFLLTKDDILILDPEGEYRGLIMQLKGQIVKISPSSNNYINPFDVDLTLRNDEDEDYDPVAEKCDFVLSMCELILGGRRGLEGDEETIIDRCVPKIYQKYLKEPIPENMPIFEDLYNEIKEQPEEAAKGLCTRLELYVTGSLKVFNHRTNVDLHNRVVSFDIKDLGKKLRKLGMLIIQEQLWQRVAMNREMKKATRVYIDEFHLLLKDIQTAAYSVEIWKRFRKWGGIPTGITQNVKDLLASAEIENIFENSDFIYMLNQAHGDAMILAEQLGISEEQIKQAEKAEAGQGLVIYGGAILPFSDDFPKNTKLYKLMTTKPEEQ